MKHTHKHNLKVNTYLLISWSILFVLNLLGAIWLDSIAHYMIAGMCIGMFIGIHMQRMSLKHTNKLVEVMDLNRDFYKMQTKLYNQDVQELTKEIKKLEKKNG